MDPTRVLRPKGWRSYGWYAAWLLILTTVMAAGGWIASMSGLDPRAAYRLAALAFAGAAICGLIWVGSKGMGDPSDGQ